MVFYGNFDSLTISQASNSQTSDAVVDSGDSFSTIPLAAGDIHSNNSIDASIRNSKRSRWVECYKCHTHRRLPQHVSHMSEFDDRKFDCTMNTWDTTYNDCSVAQQQAWHKVASGGKRIYSVDMCDPAVYSKRIPPQWAEVLEREANHVYRSFDDLGVALDHRAMCLRKDALVDMLELLQVQRFKKGELQIIIQRD